MTVADFLKSVESIEVIEAHIEVNGEVTHTFI